MLEVVGGIFIITGILSLIGGCMLLFYTGMQLSKAIEIHNETINAIASLRDNISKEHDQIQEWIELINTTTAESELKTTAVREFCARGFAEMGKNLEEIKHQFDALSVVKDKYLN